MRIFRWRPGSAGVAFCLLLLLGAAVSSADVLHLIASETPYAGSVSSHSDGGFTVAWKSGNFGDIDVQLYLQRFDAGGAPAAPRQLIREGLIHDYIRVSTDAAGNDLVLWVEGITTPHVSPLPVVSAFSSSGELLWGPAAITYDPAYGTGYSLSIAPAPGGGWLAAWIIQRTVGSSQAEVLARRLDPLTGAGEPVTLLDPTLHGGAVMLAVAGSASRMLLVWDEKIGDGPNEASTFRAFGRLLDSQGQPAGPVRDLGVAGIGLWAMVNLEVSGYGQDRFFAAWNSKVSQTSPFSIGGLALNGDVPVGPPFVIRNSDLDRVSPLSLGVDRLGRAILGWNEFTYAPPGASRSFVYRFSVSGAPLSDLDEVSALPGFSSGFPAAVSASPDGHWVAVWPRIANADAPAGIDALLGLSVDGCIAETNALCLTGNRFRVTASYHDHLGRDGVGVAAPLTSESGTFWFFSPESVELILKVVDACSHPDFGNFWVFASGLTDVQVHLSVVDTWTGATWERDTSLGEPFPPALDTAAFDTCGATPTLVHP